MTRLLSFRPKTFLARLALILALFGLPAISPPLADDPSETMLPGGPETVQAGGIPTIDIGQIFGHLTNFAQMLDQVSQIRKQYNLVRDNFRTLASITGWDALDSFFKPIDDFFASTFDPVFEVARLGYGGWKSLRDDYYDYEKGSMSGKSLQKQVTHAGSMTMEMLKDTFTEPAKANRKLDSLQAKIQHVNSCIEEAAKGNLSARQCQAHLESLGVRQMGQIEKALAKQTALIAAQGLNDRATIRHRREVLGRLRDRARQETFDFVDNGPQYTDVLR